MAHHRKYHQRLHHNPLGISGAVVKDVAFNAAGLAASNFGAGFLNQSGWLDVLATAGVAFALSFVGKSVAGEAASEELFKGGILAALIKAVKQTGIAVPGLSGYVPSYFSAPTTSDAYGRATAPTIMLPAPAPAGKGMGYGVATPYTRYRSRFVTRF